MRICERISIFDVHTSIYKGGIYIYIYIYACVCVCVCVRVCVCVCVYVLFVSHKL